MGHLLIIEFIRKHQGLVVMHHWFFNVCIAFLSTILFLAFIEIAFRLALHYDDVKTFQSFKNIGQMDRFRSETQHTTLRQMIRHSDNSHIIYELMPNISVLFLNKRLTVNSHGFRSPLYNISKSNETIRIVGLGDSLMFGWGVNDDEYYLALLSKYLHQSSSLVSNWEIVNTAVPGYNTVMEVETLKAKGLDYSPDLVIIDFVGNDLDLPNFIREEENYLSLRRLFAAEYFFNRLARRSGTLHDGFVDAPWDTSRNGFESNPSRVPARYKDMVGPDAYRSAMTELKSLGIRHNFQIIVFTTYFPRVIKEILRDLDLPILEAGDRITEFLVKQGFKDYVDSPVALSTQDPHPSALGHTILADVLYNYLKDGEILRQIFQRRGMIDPSE